jgi:signal transduction histidine kinase
VGEGLHAERRVLRVLVLEDDEDDFELLRREIARLGWSQVAKRVQSRDELCAALDADAFDLVISDWSMPGFDALGALNVLRERKVDLPFIIVSGTIGEEAAVRALKAGASDFVAKGNLQRLGASILRELREAKTREERREAVEALRLAVQVRDEFLSLAGHELRTPLTTLRLQVQAMLRLREKNEPPARMQERLCLVERSTHRLHALVDRLLDISQVAQQGVSLERRPCDLSHIVADVVARFADAGAASQLEVSTPGPCVGNWDDVRIETVVTNLVSNALKYGGGRPVRVMVEDAGPHVRLTVQDQGIGIAEPDQERIFERFNRAASGRSYGGFGIGLWLVRELARAHGGRVELTSAPDRGSTFVVTLPKA